MFENFLRKTLLKKFSEDDQQAKMLLKDRYKMHFLAAFFVSLFPALPLAVVVMLLLKCEYVFGDVFPYIIIMTAYFISVVYFPRIFPEAIQTFTTLIAFSLYFSRYVLKGNALSADDFTKIQKEDITLYNGIKWQDTSGYCYSVCFDMLKHLKKGAIQFTATKALTEDKQKNEYTMHLLYVNNGWCFDTYSGRQHPLEEVMKRRKAKVYATYSYEDIKGITYETFRKEYIHSPEIHKWCEENDCWLINR